MQETELYEPVKALLEARGYEVKAEVCGCDVVGVRDGEPPVIVELKTRFSLALVLQGIDRLAVTDNVYVAFAIHAAGTRGGKNSLWRKHKKAIGQMCRRLGLGLISVELRAGHKAVVDIHLDPVAYTPRKNKKRAQRLLGEFAQRAGDPNVGGVTGRTIMTAYRQDALRCLAHVSTHGPVKLADLRAATGVARAAGILQNNHYGWFERAGRGVYQITPKGRQGLAEFAGALE